MKFLFISRKGLGLPLAHRIKQEGNDVVAFVKEAAGRRLWQPILPLVDEWRPHATPQSVDVVVFDEPGAGRIADELRSQGLAVFGAGALVDKLTQPQVPVLTEARSGLPPAEKTLVTSNSVEELIRYIKRNPGAYRFHAKEILYISSGPDELIRMLPFLKKTAGLNTEMKLTQRELGTSVGLFTFFNGDKFIDPIYLVFEQLEQELGLIRGREDVTGVLLNAARDGVPIIREREFGLKKELQKASYRGPIRIDVVVGEQVFLGGIQAVTADPVTFAALEDAKRDIASIILGIASGSLSEMDAIDGRFIAAVPVHFTARDPVEGTPIFGVRRTDLPHVWFTDMHLDREHDPMTAGVFRTVMVLTGSGDTAEIAVQRVREIAENVKVPETNFRTDGILRLAQVLQFEDLRRRLDIPEMQEPIRDELPQPVEFVAPVHEGDLRKRVGATKPTDVSDDNSGLE